MAKVKQNIQLFPLQYYKGILPVHLYVKKDDSSDSLFDEILFHKYDIYEVYHQNVYDDERLMLKRD